MAGGVADEEDRRVGRFAQRVGYPVALVAHGVGAEIVGEADRRLLDVKPRVEGSDPNAQLVARGEAPAVAGRYIGAVDPDLEVGPGAERMHLEAPRKQRIGGLDVLP